MIVLFGLIIFLYVMYRFQESDDRKRRRYLIDKLPGPPAYPIVGSIGHLVTVGRGDRIKQAIIHNERYGPIYKIWASFFPVVNVMKAEDAEIVLSSSVNINKAKVYSMFKPWLGEGLLIAGGQKWHERRKMLTPAFHFSILETFFDVFIENSKIFTNMLEKEVGNTFDVFPYISSCALDIICESAMGVKVNTQTGSSIEYLQCVKRMTELITDRIIYPWLYIKWIFKLSENYKEQRRALEVLHGMSNKLINQRKLQRKEQRNKTVDDDEFTGKKKKAFLDLLLDIAEESEGKLTDVDIREEVDTFMFEGHDTTAAALVWTIYLLGRHPDVQKKAYEELQSVFSSDDQTPTIKDMNQLKYLECVIKETLRLFPSVPFIARQLSQDVKLSGYEIPKGTSVIIHLIRLHQQSESFQNPEKFDPSNFAIENAHKRPAFAYVPFSAGPRNCIGQKFAMLELKVVISTFLRKYEVEAVHKMEELKMAPDTIIRPLAGVQVKITPRS